MYIVTGGAGFIGSAIVWKLNNMGVDDILIVDDLGHDDTFKNLVGLRFSDYLHKDDFLVRIEGHTDPFNPAALIHMGANSSTTETDAERLMRVNYHYSKSVCQYATSRDARFIHASSASTYGDGSRGFDDDPATLDDLRPLNMYALTKHLFDLWLRRHGFLSRVASLKFFNVFGPNEYHKGEMRSVVCKAFEKIRDTGRLALFKSDREDYPDGGQMRDFVWVKDCAEVVWWLLENPHAGGILNVGTGQARTWNDLARAVFAAMGREPKIDYVEMPAKLRGKYQYFTEARVERLRAAGYQAPMTPLEDAVADYVTGYLATNNPYLSAAISCA
ncbi:ADP-glyceromanno-heptose 6-epimerase [Desulfolutivibrio sp.]|uniref:ADP-glyceromanno-heptose 6-epimerase n=1 Tax=Desulfolutivibrio sp. TaxID=2773296 RepID=UPI002F966963